MCGKGTLKTEVSEFRSAFTNANGTTKDVVVPDVTKYRCDVCDEYILDPHSENKISAAQRRAMGLLAADELIAFRKGLTKSQEAMSDLLGLGKKTWCRWESNDYFQSEASDRFLRLLMFVPDNVAALELIKLRKESSEIDLSDTFKFIKNLRVAQQSAERLGDYLIDGPFRNR
jgi:putative zinc finger/helix-turn-helix YgiT family protein